MKRALFRWSDRRVARHTSTRAPFPCRRIRPGRSFRWSPSSGSRQGAWARNLCEECILPEGKTPRLAEAQGMVALALSTWTEGVQDRVQVEVGREEQGEGETHGKGQNEDTTKDSQSTAHHEWHGGGVTLACRHLSQCSVMCINYEVFTA